MCVPAVWAEESFPAAVVRPAEVDEMAPVPPVDTATPTGPAADVSASEGLGPLPTAAQLHQEAIDAANAKRPAPLQPRLIPQRVEDMGEGRFLILPRDKPLRSDGTLGGYMFNDKMETTVPEPTPPVLIEPVSPTVETPSVTTPVRIEPSATVPPHVVAPALPRPLTLHYSADATWPDGSADALRTWAKKLPARVKMTVTTATLAPPLGSSADEIANQRWHVIQGILKKAGVTVGRVSFVRVKEPTKQTVTLKVIP